ILPRFTLFLSGSPVLHLSSDHLTFACKQADAERTLTHGFSVFFPLDLNFQYFWKWSAFEDYLLFCFGFTVLCAVVTLLLLDSAVFVETLGSLALMFEAMLGLPQLLQNFDNRSTKGMSVKMVLLWTAGDVFKTTYFVMNESPAQFWVCGSVQIMIDVFILLQVLLYNQDSRVKLG
uniref:Si:dkey-246g23.2 n=1 Tax=Acanthochromis polyacanthus TaxID=80966 RepID=A0A3Q1EHI7_9TELE